MPGGSRPPRARRYPGRSAMSAHAPPRRPFQPRGHTTHVALAGIGGVASFGSTESGFQGCSVVLWQCQPSTPTWHITCGGGGSPAARHMPRMSTTFAKGARMRYSAGTTVPLAASSRRGAAAAGGAPAAAAAAPPASTSRAAAKWPSHMVGASVSTRLALCRGHGLLSAAAAAAQALRCDRRGPVGVAWQEVGRMRCNYVKCIQEPSPQPRSVEL
ncbi:MAG: hypothetical protein J3K34DRAFT_398975 [Monoraphidium minutum]|nr:MAG: hypothetical protein J3K34DRAFT_398975 [Monoraphidium minutum]